MMMVIQRKTCGNSLSSENRESPLISILKLIIQVVSVLFLGYSSEIGEFYFTCSMERTPMPDMPIDCRWVSNVNK